MKPLYLWIVTCCCCLCFSIAWGTENFSDAPGAKKKNILDKRFTVYGGVRLYQANGTFSSTRAKSPHVEIDMDDLDLDKNEVNAIGGFIFNFATKWNLRFDYFGYHDDALKTAGKNFNFDTLSIPINASVSTSLDMDLYVVNAAYNIIHNEKNRFGVGLGVHGIDFDLRLSGKISVNGSSVSLGEARQDFIAPIPNIWVYGAYALTDSFIFRYGGGLMSAGYGDYDGSLVLANAAIEYWPFPNTGVGIGYNYITADIDRDTDRKKENYDIDLSGLVVYISFGF